MFNDQELPHVPLTLNISPSFLKDDFRRDHEIALVGIGAVEGARIKVEYINGPVRFVSGEKDHVWPSQ
jgi:hypothetical protein